MPRMAHHRSDNRVGPHHTWLRRKAYHLMKVLRPVAASQRILMAMRPVSAGVYAVDPMLVADWRVAVEDAMPYVRDTEGTVWE
jgi:hypothetical protein